jgi:DNA-binding transcriptional ArsR family regulator|tara:strand:- start:2660 stop:2971 length:312 start_codon:yes stop_codon:yes gene_type:complete
MNDEHALAAFAALAQPTRLAAFRLLVRHFPEGLAAGELALLLDVTPATLSFHLGNLERSRLLTSTRQGRKIIYRIEVKGTRGLLDFLMQDCCMGRPDLCGLAG